MDNSTTTPWKNLISMAQIHLSKMLPNKHNVILGGQCRKSCEIFALDLLLHHKIPGAISFHRLNADKQYSMIGGVEELLFEDLPSGIYDFYQEKIDEELT